MRKLLMQACRITRVYRAGEPGEVQALRGVNLRIYAGDFLAILGAEGAGKTTLLRLLSLTDRPTAGDLYYEGRLVTGLSDDELNAIHPALLLIDDPPAELLDQLRHDNDLGQTIVLATDDPEVAAHGRTLYRIENGLIYPIGG
ncbi:MAG TPA: ATP-binding cassette domain-containing protein [Symbiobacteriaceae bacterium]|nr:ATP-binding cassette domain-containing protein [Symbiobacteriaceae bacterium]